MRKLFLIPLLAFTFAFTCRGDKSESVDSVVPAPDDTVLVVPTPPVDEVPEPTVDEVPDSVGPDVNDSSRFCRQGTACDVAGDPTLAWLVNPSISTFQIMQLKFYHPGDDVAFILCAKTTNSQPVPGVPATVRVKQTGRLLAGDGLTLTGKDGCAVAEGVVTEADLHEGPGSYIVNGYLGGRVLNQVRILPDSLF